MAGRGNSKSIDWARIKLRYEAGESATSISESLGGRPTRQGIMKHVHRENWSQDQENGITVAEKLPIVQRAQALSGPTKCTAERVGFMLEMIGRGANQTIAARAAGIVPETLKRWVREDPQLGERIRQARAGKLCEWFSRIDDAATHDWKAADRLLQTSNEVDGYGPKEGAGINVVINIDRDPPTIKTVND